MGGSWAIHTKPCQNFYWLLANLTLYILFSLFTSFLCWFGFFFCFLFFAHIATYLKWGFCHIRVKNDLAISDRLDTTWPNKAKTWRRSRPQRKAFLGDTCGSMRTVWTCSTGVEKELEKRDDALQLSRWNRIRWFQGLRPSPAHPTSSSSIWENWT